MQVRIWEVINGRQVPANVEVQSVTLKRDRAELRNKGNVIERDVELFTGIAGDVTVRYDQDGQMVNVATSYVSFFHKRGPSTIRFVDTSDRRYKLTISEKDSIFIVNRNTT